MRFLKTVSVAIVSMTPIASQAALQWTSASAGGACQTVIGLTNQLANANSFSVTLSPGITGCTPSTGTIAFTEGTDGVSSTNIQALLATALFALSTGQQVMLYYDTSSCTGEIIAIGGYQNQCG